MTEHEVEILLVEDNPSDAELTLRALRKNHLANKVHIAEDGAQAIEYLFGKGETKRQGARPMPKVILLDLKLPKIGGLEVLRRIKCNEQTKTIPVVALTSSNQDSDLQECYKLGVNSYITKPVQFDAFVNAVSELGFYWMMLNQPPLNNRPD